MKNIIQIGFILSVVVALFTACNKDLGNYDYKTLDSMRIEGLQPSYIGYTGQSLNIKPTLILNNGKTFDEADYEYRWFTVEKSSTTLNFSQFQEITDTKDLTIDLALPAGNFRIYYRVKSKETGYIWEFVTDLNVTSKINTGWLLLNDIQGEARLDMLNLNPETQKFEKYTDILESTNSVKLGGKPKLVYYLYTRDAFSATFASTSKIYVGTDKGTYDINNQNKTWNSYRNLKEEVKRPTSDDYHAQSIFSRGSNSVTYLYDSDGMVCAENVTTGFLFGPSMNRFATGATIKISPRLAPVSLSGNNIMVMYDPENKYLFVHTGSNKSASQISSVNTSVFDPKSVNQDLLYMEYGQMVVKQFYALFKNPSTQKVNLARFTFNSASAINPIEFAEVIGATDIDKAEFYAVDPNYGYLMYSIGGKVYQYDPLNKQNKLLMDLGSRKVSLLKFQRIANLTSNLTYQEWSKKMMVCSYDPANPDTSGKMELYKINISTAPELSESYDGYGKIVDVSYRE